MWRAIKLSLVILVGVPAASGAVVCPDDGDTQAIKLVVGGSRMLLNERSGTKPLVGRAPRAPQASSAYSGFTVGSVDPEVRSVFEHGLSAHCLPQGP
jgi:hypothetical protein